MKLTELLTMKVVTAEGKHLGRVVDLRCEGEPEHGESRPERVVSELIYGEAGWLEQLGFRAVRERGVAWSSVIAIEDRKIIVAQEGERK
ncbi:MAG TPA: hypothetical protein VFD58_28095 [Blastocatellia bacterium]|nr:hypothetical protein [Blastocatellia bacterium]